MESPAVAVTFSLGSPICDNSVTSNHGEITRLKLVTDAASLLSDPAALLHSNTGCNWDLGHDAPRIDVNESAYSTSVESEETCKWPNTAQEIQGGDVLEARLVPESEEDEIMLIGGSSNGIDSEELLPLQVASETTSLPIAVEIEGIHEGKLVAKVISLEERSFDMKLADDIVTSSRNPIEASVSGPTIKTSVMAIPLPVEKETVKGAVKSVYELEYVPLWGSTTTRGLRPEMEDAIITAPYFMKIPIEMVIGDHKVDTISQPFSQLTSHFFGVYDGHGGSQVANYCRERIHAALAEEIGINGDDLFDRSLGDTRLMLWEKVFTSCFLKVDDEVGGKVRRPVYNTENAAPCCYTFEPVASETVGSTAVVAAICSSHIVVANCGDSRAVLYRGKEAMALSVDHKPNRDDEYDRIEAAGGKVIQWNGHRVFGVLAMSRSIGDRYLKPWIIPNPEVMFVPRAKEDECLVLASDGLWDVMSNEEACEVARRRILVWHKKNGNVPLLAERGHVADPAAQEAAEYLTNFALNKGSKDNISVIVVDLKARRKFKSKS